MLLYLLDSDGLWASRSCSAGSGSFRSDITSIENEIKELEEDENNIILLMKQIKEFSSIY